MDNAQYYQILSISYLVALALWWALYWKLLRRAFPVNDSQIDRPWVQTGLVILFAVAVIGIGRLYSAGYLLPKVHWGSLFISECLNQAIIFSPIPVFLIIHRQSFESAWLPSKHVPLRLGVGIVLGLVAVAVFSGLSGQRSYGDTLLDVFHLKNTHYAVQIFFEDMAIALLLSRLAAALGKRYFVLAILIVSMLFAAGHIPQNLEDGEPLSSILLNRFFDASLTFVVGFTLYRAKDFLWFFPIHFCMDMMQFYNLKI